MQIDLIKLGGAVTANPNALRNIPEIIAKSNNKKVFVISAFGKTTRKLVKCAIKAESNNINDAKNEIKNIFDFHLNIVNELMKGNDELIHGINNFKTNLEKIIESVSLTSELTPATLDRIMAYGEELAINIISEYLNGQNINNKIINSYDYILTNSNYNRAQPIYDKTIVNIKKIFNQEAYNDIILTQGFVAKDAKDKISTMGIESSNLTVKLIAEALDTKSIMIYTDVEGIRTIDPKIYQNSKVVSKFNYHQAKTASNSGLKLIYDQIIEFAEQNNKKVEFRSLLEPNGDFTEINGFEDNKIEPLINIIDDNYFLEMDFSRKSEAVKEITKLFANGGNFINSLVFANNKLKLKTWEKFKTISSGNDFTKKSYANILFLNQDIINKFYSTIDISELDLIESDIANGSVYFHGDKERVHKTAIMIHEMIYGGRNTEFPKQAFIECNKIAKKEGLSELTLDEINAEIEEVRKKGK